MTISFLLFFYLFIIMISGLFWGFIGYLIGKGKGINGFWWGFGLGLIGIIVVICLEDKKNMPTVVNVNRNNYSTEEYIPSNDDGRNMNKYEKIEQLARLKKIGAITEEEFEEEKKKLLGGNR